MVKIFLSFLFLNLIFGNCVLAKVASPNYNFSLDAFSFFMPGNSLADIEKKYGKVEVFEKKSSSTVYRYYVAHIRYKFPVFVQIVDGKSVDFFAKLPSYFLHDVFHQSLINRIGKQDIYSRKENTAIYVWKNIKNMKHTYVGACTITCFPIYYSVETAGEKPVVTPLLEELKKSANFK
jgi:hypothetical protein